MYDQEKKLKSMGFKLITGVDEAGRGPLAGPVVVSAVIFKEGYRNDAIQDSKKLTAIERERLFLEIKHSAITYTTCIIGWKQIDKMGILNATKLAMRRAVLSLNPLPDFVLTDAVAINIMDIPQKAIIKGDAKVFSIAAASIIAKVTRDKLMIKYDKKYPKYGFANHMGYGTPEHLNAIKQYGACPIHRMSFKPIRKD